MAKTLKFAVCGYGGAFNMGRTHATSLQAAGDAKLVAVCDPDAARQKAAEADFPGIEMYGDLDTMLKESDAELVIHITPHNLHAPLAMKCLKAGRHVVLEKPMCITTREAKQMIDAAKAKGLLVSVYHNRRWDGDYLAIRKVVESGAIGDVFNIRGLMLRYGMRTDWWRAKKAITGGSMYDWGVHITDWLLGLVPSKVVSVTGFSQKRVWLDVDVEDETQALIRFESGAVGEVIISHIRNLRENRKWEITGTKGNLLYDWNARHFEVTTERKGRLTTELVPIERTDYSPYYNGVYKSITQGKPLPVTPESAARAIAVIEAQMKSAESGRTVAIKDE